MNFKISYDNITKSTNVEFSFGWNGDFSKIYDKAREHAIAKGFFNEEINEDPENVPEADDLTEDQIDLLMDCFIEALNDMPDFSERCIHEAMLEAVISFWGMNGEEFDHDFEDFEDLEDYFYTLEEDEEDW